MNNSTLKNLGITIVGVAVLAGILFYWQNLRGVRPAVNPPAETDLKNDTPQNTTGMPLKLPDGFSIEIFAKGLPGARVMAFDGSGNMWVSRTSAGVITQLEMKDGRVIAQHDIFRNLRKPHGLAFDYRTPGLLYFAEENKITRVTLNSDDPGQKIADLPSGGGHFTRTLGFGPEDLRLYVSIGSSCNVCNEGDLRRAAVYSMNPDGSDFKKFASGLRNTVFFTWSYVDGRMWGTDMGRDNLGDNLPPEDYNILAEGEYYGWPICYGNKVNDRNFDKNQYIRDPCQDSEAPKVEMPAHSAPLGLAFVPEEGWPEDYWHDLIVAFHGSWNRSDPTGYKLVRVKLDSKGNFEEFEDFITGWLQGNTVLGRPVDVVFYNRGLYVSDDKSGVIYKITSVDN